MVDRTSARPAQRPQPRRRAHVQLSFVLEGADQPRGRNWGGRRAGAGRKRAGPKRVAHVTRPLHAKRHPVHVTLRAHPSVPSFRNEAVRELLRHLLVKMKARKLLNVAHFSIQHDHLHLLVESDDKGTLSSGLRSLIISFAQRLNLLLGRISKAGKPRGKVWGDRYHRQDLASPTQTRNTLLYVLNNFRKHARLVAGDGIIDPLSSSPYFAGWSRPTIARLLRANDTEPWPAFTTRTWLLGIGWQRAGGLLDPRATPGTRSRR